MKLKVLFHLILYSISFLHKLNAFSMTVYPIDSPRLNILPESFTKEDRHEFLRNMSVARANNFSKRNAKLGPSSIDYPLSHTSGYFLAQLNFGTINPPFTPYVVIDFASDHTWVQCTPCDPCFKLDGSINAESSTTFAKLTLDDKRCDTKISYEGVCGYETGFHDGNTKGYIGTDIFAFSNAAGNLSYFPNIAFGCGVQNNNFDWGDASGKIAGVHGLGVGPRSFLNQLSDDINGRFTYCLKPDPDEATITFGDAAQISGDVQTIAMNPDARYHLHMSEISVDHIPVAIPSSVFDLDDKNFRTGFFLDPSTPRTVLNVGAYAPLVAYLTAYFGIYEWIPIPFTTTHITDLCYIELPLPELGQFFPTIIFHFKKPDGRESTLELDTDTVFHKRFPLPGFCLGIGSTTGPSIFGADFQANHRFLFDVNAQSVSFSPEDC